MVMKYWAYVLMGLLIASSAFVVIYMGESGQAKTQLAETKAAYGAQTWYLGQGVEKGLFVKYRISTFDYLQSGGHEFNATIWFGPQDDKGDWITFVIIEEEGKVVASNIPLSALLAPIGFDVTEEFKPYRNAIRNSLGWVGDFASKDRPKPITGNTAWGVVGAIGGGSIVVKPTGTETLQLAGKSWDTSVIGFHYAVDSKIWINANFPLPLKAKVYTIATQQPLPVQFEYELVEVGKSDTRPVPPASKIEPPKSPLSSTTTSGAFNVELYWKPEIIEPNKPITMGVVFSDRKQTLIKDALYDILITDANGKIVLDKKQVLTTEGQGTHEVTFESIGSVHVTVTFLGSASGFEHKITEKAEFDLVVVPEFPLGIATVMAAVVSMMIAMTRFKKISLPRF